MTPIKSFRGHYKFLSNFYPCLIWMDGMCFRSVEHAYQAAKFPEDERGVFLESDLTPGQAKRLGRGKGGPDWRARSLDIMLELLRLKFQEPRLLNQLLATGDAELIEGNDWGDTFFGVCNGTGENWLGKLLMRVREELYAETIPTTESK